MTARHLGSGGAVAPCPWRGVPEDKMYLDLPVGGWA